ncbi:MAG: hypothetical protein NUW37_12235 [Planctomycetes bacterium]|nr:hypothetical protein [Planctomycetota bacterium]
MNLAQQIVEAPNLRLVETAEVQRRETDVCLPLPLPLDMPDLDIGAVVKDDFVELLRSLEKESHRLKLELKYMELTRKKNNVLRGIVLRGDFKGL